MPEFILVFPLPFKNKLFIHNANYDTGGFIYYIRLNHISMNVTAWICLTLSLHNIVTHLLLQIHFYIKNAFFQT